MSSLSLSEILAYAEEIPKYLITKTSIDRAEHWIITGGLGFIGIHVIEYLTARSIQVYIVTRHPKGVAESRLRELQAIYKVKVNSGLVSFIQGDITENQWALDPRMWQLCTQARVCLNCAADLNVFRSLKYLYMPNCRSVFPLLHLLSQGVKVIHLSSLSVFASSNWPLKEPCPETFPFEKEIFHGGYAQSKILAELYLKAGYIQGSLIMCRPSLVIGTAERGIEPPQGIKRQFEEALREIGGVPLNLPNGEANICRVDWLAEKLYELSILESPTLSFIHLANKKNTTLSQLVLPLELPRIDESTFMEKAKYLSPLQQVLINNAFNNPQPGSYRNYDLFQSTNRIYSTHFLERTNHG